MKFERVMDWLPLFLFTLAFITPFVQSQQDYSGNSVLDCYPKLNKSEPPSASLYSCNRQFSSCKAFLIFRSHNTYNSVPIIATLTSSNQTEIARINNVTELTVFPEDTEVIIPVNCSCSAGYYEAITKYNIPTTGDTYFTIANDTFEGLSSCTSLMRANALDQFELVQGIELEIPLRCACPSQKQAANGVRNLVTYPVKWHDSLTTISKSFKISATSLVESNRFTNENATLYPFTTLLVPLFAEPSSRIKLSLKHNLPIAAPLPRSNVVRSRSHTGILVGGMIATGFAFLLALVFSYLIITFRKKSPNRFSKICKTNDVKEEASSDRDIHVEIASIDTVIRLFSYKELKKATKNFSSKRKIKGCVYRGILHKKEVIAIKKMQGKEACKEVSMLSRINHFNIIKLQGFCEYHNDCFLVFEYMKNGSLLEWINNKKIKKSTKTLPLRIQIALDIANGLLYLHNFAKPAYVHKNINSEHILLDNNLRAKISNLGSAKAAVESASTSSNARTRMVVGTKGYMAPEYLNKGIVTPKIDVYGFGVVLLEIITGKDVLGTEEGRGSLLDGSLAGENIENGLRRLVESELGENGEAEFGFQVVKLSLSCLMHEPMERPNMEEVVSALVKIQMNVQKLDRMWDHESPPMVYYQG